MKQKLYIITGLSGSDKTTAIKAFEDASFYCVDNMPIVLLPKFLDLPLKKSSGIKGFAFVMDMRSQNFIENYSKTISLLENLGTSCATIFLKASVDTLLKRFNHTRRQHPVSNKKNLLGNIKSEKKILGLFSNKHKDLNLMKINIVSFGFKYRMPNNTDFVIDVRFLLNPYFVASLKNQDGESKGVKKFIFANEEAKVFLKKFLNLLDYLIPLYKKENKAYLTLAI